MVGVWKRSACKLKLDVVVQKASTGTSTVYATSIFRNKSSSFFVHTIEIYSGNRGKGKGNGEAVPLQAWSGPEDSRNLSFLDFMTTAQDGGKVVSLTNRPPLHSGNVPGTHFC